MLPLLCLPNSMPMCLPNCQSTSIQSRRVGLVVVPIQPVLLGHVAVEDILLDARNTCFARKLVRLGSQQAFVVHLHRYDAVSICRPDETVRRETYWWGTGTTNSSPP